jgi:SAM-dependent methyltransferase
VYGYRVRILNEASGEELTAPNRKGMLTIDGPLPPGCMQTVWRDDERFVKTYWSTIGGKQMYSTFDWGVKDADGYFYILGRTDDAMLPAAGVDLVLLVDAYHEFDRPWEMARSIRRALRPGGRVALVEYRAEDPSVPIKPLHRMSVAQARLEWEAAGFRWISTDERLPIQHLIWFAKE